MKEFFKKRWKPLAFISGLGGILFGGAVVAYRKGYVPTSPQGEPIPDDAQWVILRTSPFDVQAGNSSHRVWSEYHLQQTRFRVWNVMTEGSQGFRVYFVTPNQHLINEDAEKTIRMEPFYAMVGIPQYFKRTDLMDHLRRGSQAVFHICLVGGGSTGIPTGEKMLSCGTIAEWEFLLSE